MSTLPLATRQAVRRFHGERADYYEDLSSLLTSTQRKMQQVFEQDAQRYEGSARGVLAALWLQRFIDNGANLALAWQGSLPEDEVAVLHVLQDAGADAVPTALLDMARMARLSDATRKASTTTLRVAVVALILAALGVTVLPVFAVAQLQASLDMPVAAWGRAGQALAAWAVGVRHWWLAWALLSSVALYGVHLSVRRWTGPGRERADRSLALYQFARDLAAVRFLLVMSTLTRKRAGVMFTLTEALQQLAAAAANPWMRWRLEQVQRRIEDTGATSCEVFDTGLLAPPMYWRLRDVEEGQGFAQAFALTADHVEKSLVPRLLSRLQTWRWAMLLLAVGCTLVMVFWIQTVTSEMKSAVLNYTGG